MLKRSEIRGQRAGEREIDYEDEDEEEDDSRR